MKEYFVYPFIFKWENVVPIDYPFVQIKGPGESIGCLLVFDSMEKYMEYCGDDYHSPITIGRNDGKLQN